MKTTGKIYILSLLTSFFIGLTLFIIAGGVDIIGQQMNIVSYRNTAETMGTTGVMFILLACIAGLPGFFKFIYNELLEMHEFDKRINEQLNRNKRG